MSQRKFLNLQIILISSTLLFACGSGSGGGSDTVIDSATQNASEFGAITMSGPDISAKEGVFNPNINVSDLIVRNRVSMSWVRTTENIQQTITLKLSFDLDGVIVFADLFLNENRTYTCGVNQPACTGIVRDPSKKTVTFKNAILHPLLDQGPNNSTTTVNLNGTLKHTEPT